jgi:hypothetical protein
MLLPPAEQAGTQGTDTPGAAAVLAHGTHARTQMKPPAFRAHTGTGGMHLRQGCLSNASSNHATLPAFSSSHATASYLGEMLLLHAEPFWVLPPFASRINYLRRGKTSSPCGITSKQNFRLL